LGIKKLIVKIVVPSWAL